MNTLKTISMRILALLAIMGFANSALGQLSGGMFEATGNDTVARYFHAASLLNEHRVMVTGGLNISFLPPTLISRDDISFYDPDTGTFTDSYNPLNGGAAINPSLLVARSSHTQTTLYDGRVLITGGHENASGTSPGTAISSVEVFDPQAGVVSFVQAMSVARAAHTATLLPDGRVVVAGGSTWQIFDPLTNQWSSNASLMRSRSAHAAVLLRDFAGGSGDDRVLLIGGSGSGPATIEMLDPLMLTSTLQTATLGVGVDDLAAIDLPDGRVFIVGGQNASNGDTVANAYIYDPVTDSISSAPSVPNRTNGIADHEIVRIGNTVIIFGGEQEVSGTDTELNYAATFDATTEQWLDDGTMLNIHDDFTATPISRCAVLLVDGGVPFIGQEIPSANAEVFWLTDSGLCLEGDINNDGMVNANDYIPFWQCLTGPVETIANASCASADLDDDNDVDLSDFATLTQAIAP